jgi:peptide/nickel transport system permease protein
MRLTRDRVTLQPTFTPDPSSKIGIAFFVRGAEYDLFGLFRTNLHLIGSADPSVTFYPLGADRLGRCVWSRLAVGTQISMSIGLVGVTLSLVIGILLGGISGYYGGSVDFAIQRVIEFVLSLPHHPDLARDGRRPAAVLAAHRDLLHDHAHPLPHRLGAARPRRPRPLPVASYGRLRHGRAPRRRLGEADHLPSHAPLLHLAHRRLHHPRHPRDDPRGNRALLPRPRPPAPVVSWGVLLREAQNIRSIASAPWLFAPGVAVVIAVLALNFLGDGLRDASDPYDR